MSRVCSDAVRRLVLAQLYVIKTNGQVVLSVTRPLHDSCGRRETSWNRELGSTERSTAKLSRASYSDGVLLRRASKLQAFWTRPRNNPGTMKLAFFTLLYDLHKEVLELIMQWICEHCWCFLLPMCIFLLFSMCFCNVCLTLSHLVVVTFSHAVLIATDLAACVCRITSSYTGLPNDKYMHNMKFLFNSLTYLSFEKWSSCWFHCPTCLPSLFWVCTCVRVWGSSGCVGDVFRTRWHVWASHIWPDLRPLESGGEPGGPGHDWEASIHGMTIRRKYLLILLIEYAEQHAVVGSLAATRCIPLRLHLDK